MIKITVIEEGEIFGVMRSGDLRFWRVEDGQPVEKDIWDVPEGDHTLKLEDAG